MDAITVVWDTTAELLQVLYLQFMEGPAAKMLMMLNEYHGIYYHTTGLLDGSRLSTSIRELPMNVLIAAK